MLMETLNESKPQGENTVKKVEKPWKSVFENKVGLERK